MQALNIILSTCNYRKCKKLSVVLMHKNKCHVHKQLITLYGKKLFQDYELVLKQISVLVLAKWHLGKFKIFFSFFFLSKCKIQKMTLTVIFKNSKVLYLTCFRKNKKQMMKHCNFELIFSLLMKEC